MSAEENTGRPTAITVTLFGMALLGLSAIIYSFTGALAPFGLLYPAANMLIIVGMFASFAGIGSMERWGIWLFLVMLALKFGLDLYTGAFRAWELTLLLPAGIFLAHLKRMR